MQTADTLSREERRQLIQAISDAIREGFPPPSRKNQRGVKTAYQRAAEVTGKTDRQVVEMIYRARKDGDVPDWGDIAERTRRAEPETPWLERPVLPSGEVPINDLIEGLTQRSERLLHAHSARSWFKINVRADGPFGVAWLGDPHMDSPGCNWKLLRRDIDIIKRTPGLFAANCGDSIDNWWGRLIALKGKSFVTDEEAWRLVEWLIHEIGEDNWLLWLLGNHDEKNNSEHLWKRVCKNLIHMADWQARFEIVAPNGRGCKVWAAHSFSGHSMWNPLHGGQRAAKFSGGKADLLIQGHHHEWALFSSENPESKSIYWLAKARGYKFADDYGEHHGYFPQDGGASIVSIIDPDSPTEAGFLQCFPDLESGADYLAFKRRKAAA